MTVTQQFLFDQMRGDLFSMFMPKISCLSVELPVIFFFAGPDIESATCRLINLRIKGTGLFWKWEHAEDIIFLRSLILTGKLKNACRKGLGIVRNMFNNNTVEDLPQAA